MAQPHDFYRGARMLFSRAGTVTAHTFAAVLVAAIQPTTQAITPGAHALDVLTFATKAALAFAAFWVAMSKIVKPLYKWWREYGDARRKALAAEIREILQPELEKLSLISSCNSRLDVVILRQKALFVDIDDFLQVARNNTERVDEINGLLDVVGFSTDRRSDDDRRRRIDVVLNALTERQKSRRRIAEAEAEIEARVERERAGSPLANTLKAFDVFDDERGARGRTDHKRPTNDMREDS